MYYFCPSPAKPFPSCFYTHHGLTWAFHPAQQGRIQMRAQGTLFRFSSPMLWSLWFPPLTQAEVIIGAREDKGLQQESTGAANKMQLLPAAVWWGETGVGPTAWLCPHSGQSQHPHFPALRAEASSNFHCRLMPISSESLKLLQAETLQVT